MELTVVYLSAYHDSDPCSGDVVSAACETLNLRKQGFVVCELFRELGIDKPEQVELPLIVEFLKERLDTVDVVITAQPEIFKVGVEISRLTGALHIFRQHLDYSELARMARKLSINLDRIFTRLPYKEMLSAYNEALKKADCVVSAEAGVAKPSNSYVSFPPICMGLNFEPQSFSSIGRKHVSIAISGRFGDPLKGGERILETFIALDRNENVPEFIVKAYGSVPNDLISKFRDVLGDRFIHKGWFSNRSEYFSEMSKSDVFVSFPYYESYGMAIHESVKLGLVPLSTKCGLALELSRRLDSEKVYSSCFVTNEVNLDVFVLNAKEKLLHIINNIESIKSGMGQMQSMLEDMTNSALNMSDILVKAKR